jgi:hypothetical protein
MAGIPDSGYRSLVVPGREDYFSVLETPAAEKAHA